MCIHQLESMLVASPRKFFSSKHACSHTCKHTWAYQATNLHYIMRMYSLLISQKRFMGVITGQGRREGNDDNIHHEIKCFHELWQLRIYPSTNHGQSLRIIYGWSVYSKIHTHAHNWHSPLRFDLTHIIHSKHWEPFFLYHYNKQKSLSSWMMAFPFFFVLCLFCRFPGEPCFAFLLTVLCTVHDIGT